MQKTKRIFHIFDSWAARNSLNSQKGATLVEFSLIALVLFTLLFAIIEFGMYLYNQQVITNASREGARAGIVSGKNRVSASEIITVVNDYCQDHLVTFGEWEPQKTDITITVDDPDPECDNPCLLVINNPTVEDLKLANFGNILEVNVTFKYGSIFLPFMNKTIIAQTIMRYE